MKVVFSDHANLKIAQRKLSRKKILAIVARPDLTKLGHSSREELFKRFGKNHLKVVIVRERDAIIVVTAHWVAIDPRK